MRFLTRLAPETEKLLQKIEQKSKYYQVRQRAKCIQLSYQGYEINKIMKILGVSRNTIYNWLNNWEKYNLTGLYNQKGRGRKNKLDREKEKLVKQWIKESPKNLKTV
jgi:transposase